MKKLFCLIGSALLLLAFCGCDALNSDRILRFGTGGTGGNYYEYGNLLSDLVQNEYDGITLDVQTTEGSSANLRLISKGFLDLAIVQNDTLYDAVHGENSFKDAAVNNVRAISALYDESLQIVVAADSDIYSVSDLSGKVISLGEKDSGVINIAENVLKCSGISLNKIHSRNLSFADSAKALATGEIDAFFAVAGAPTTAIYELSKETNIRLLSLDDNAIALLKKLHPQYQSNTIKANSYNSQEDPVKTIGVKAVLVCDSKMSSDTIEKITKVLFEHSEDIKYGTKERSGPNTKYGTKNVDAPFHEGAAEYYKDQGITVKTETSNTKSKKVQASQDS